MSGKQVPAHRPEVWCAGVRAGGKGGREHHRIGALAVGLCYLAHGVCGGDLHQICALRIERERCAIGARSAPFAGGQRAVGEHRQMAVRKAQVSQGPPAGDALVRGQVVVPVNKAAAARQAGERGFELRVVAFIGEEPKVR